MNYPLFLHCHIFKNAGTSLIESFRSAFPGKAIELEPADPDDYLSEELIIQALAKNPELVFISSHRLRLPLPLSINNRRVIPIVLFRDPIDRLGSVYRFEKNESRSTVYSALAKTSSMPAFFETIIDVGFDPIVANIHMDFCSMGFKYSFEDIKNYIKENALIGLVEDYHFSMALIEKEIKKHFPNNNLMAYEENVTRDGREVISNCRKTIDELGICLSKKIIMKNYDDYQLYSFICDLLRSAWADEANQAAYADYCQRNKIDNKHGQYRLKNAPSLEHFENNNVLPKEQGGHLVMPHWLRLHPSCEYSSGKPIAEAVKIECINNHIGMCLELGQTLVIDFRVRWITPINNPVVGVIIKNHRGVKVYSINNLSVGIVNMPVGGGVSLNYQFKIIIPEIVSGLYKIDLQVGMGLGVHFKVITVAEAATAFGVKTSISAGSNIVVINDAKFRTKYMVR